jgi:hypothetical protein
VAGEAAVATETDSNYANQFSFFDRLLGTYTPSSRATSVEYGIQGYDAPEHQSLGAVLLIPFGRTHQLGKASSTRGRQRGQTLVVYLNRAICNDASRIHLNTDVAWTLPPGTVGILVARRLLALVRLGIR